MNYARVIRQELFLSRMHKKPLAFDDISYLDSLRQKEAFALHIHWDGSIPAEALFRLAQKRGKVMLLPETNREGQKINYQPQTKRIINSAEKLREFQMRLREYSIIDVFAMPIGFMQTKEDLNATAVAHCHYLKKQNILYAESRFAPQYHLQNGLSLEQVIGYALEGFDKGKEETGVIVRSIICIGREVDGEYSKEIVRAALKFQGKVVGIDLACEENGNPPEKHYAAFRMTFGSSLKRTVHAGEMCSKEENYRNIQTSLDLLRADGLGHALQLHERDDLVEKVVERKVRIESNPISNYNFFIDNIEDLHLDELVKKGVLVTINPDDPAMWQNGDLAHNLYIVGKLYGDWFVDAVLKNAVKCAWGLSKKEQWAHLKKMQL